MKKLKRVEYFHRGNVDKSILKKIDNEDIIALEIYDDGTIKYVGIKNQANYILNGEN